jgi:hypothetical protein
MRSRCDVCGDGTVLPKDALVRPSHSVCNRCGAVIRRGPTRTPPPRPKKKSPPPPKAHVDDDHLSDLLTIARQSTTHLEAASHSRDAAGADDGVVEAPPSVRELIRAGNSLTSMNAATRARTAGLRTDVIVFGVAVVVLAVALWQTRTPARDPEPLANREAASPPPRGTVVVIAPPKDPLPQPPRVEAPPAAAPPTASPLPTLAIPSALAPFPRAIAAAPPSPTNADKTPTEAAPSARTTPDPSVASADAPSEAAPSATATPSAAPQSLARAIEAAAADPAPPFDRIGALSALRGAAVFAQSCKRSEADAGQGSAAVTFLPSGAASAVTIEGAPYAGAPISGCLASLFKNVRIPAFSGSAITVRKSFSIE